MAIRKLYYIYKWTNEARFDTMRCHTYLAILVYFPYKNILLQVIKHMLYLRANNN